MSAVNIIINIKELVSNFTSAIINNTKIMVDKLHNLEATNVNLAKELISNNKLREAYKRLKIINLIWPSNEECVYLFSILLILNNEVTKAHSLLDKLKSEVLAQKLLLLIDKDRASDISDIIVENGAATILNIQNVL